MLGKLLKILVVLIMISGIAGSGYFWNETRNRDQQINGLEQELDAANKRMHAIQKKYAQEKAKLGTCMRMKLAEESQKIKFQKQVQDLIKEKEAVLAQKETLEKQYQASLAAQENRGKIIQAYKDKIAKMDQRYQTLMEKYKAGVELDREKTGKIRQLEAEKKEVQFELTQTEKRLERSLKHNQRLCVLSEELVGKYWDKKKNMADPFTKIGLVELEHLVQEYLKKIDKEKVIEQ